MPRLFDYRVESTLAAPPGSVPPGIALCGLPELWPDATGQGVVVAVIDSGCDVRHPDLQPAVIGGCNFVSGQKPDDLSDQNGHGTHVAGTIAAQGRISGGAPGASLLILKVFDASGQCSNLEIVRALDYAVGWRGPRGERVRVINMSLGSSQPDADIASAVRKAAASDILVVCAAGNEGDGRTETSELAYPAAYPETVAVGAVDLNLKTCAFSNTNNEIDVAAPGFNVLSTWPGGGFAVLSGTSMAAPHVTGLAACLVEKFTKRVGRPPGRNELYDIVRLMTIDIGQAGIDVATGAGLVSVLPRLLKAG